MSPPYTLDAVAVGGREGKHEQHLPVRTADGAAPSATSSSIDSI